MAEQEPPKITATLADIAKMGMDLQKQLTQLRMSHYTYELQTHINKHPKGIAKIIVYADSEEVLNIIRRKLLTT